MGTFDGVHGFLCTHCEKAAALTDQGIRNHLKDKHNIKKPRIGLDHSKRPVEECKAFLGKLSLNLLKRGCRNVKSKPKRAYHFKNKGQGKMPVINAETKSILIHCLLEVPITFGQARFIQSGGTQ